MGLLTNDNSLEEGSIVRLLRNHANKLSFLCYVSAVLVAGLLVTDNYIGSTYFSDNALLPGLVNREFTIQPYLTSVLERLKALDKSQSGKFPADWIASEFRSIGLHTYQHNYTLNYPFGSEPKIQGKNVYAILRAPRAPHTEALVLSSPYSSFNSLTGTTIPGIALMFSLAKYFSAKNYWAKDLIFLVSDTPLVGFQAWLEAYHEVDKSPVLDYGFLEAKSGPIQGAINLEVHSEDISRLEIKIEGLNGQLPNLDLFNVAVELATRESVTPTFHGRSHPFSADFYEVTKEYALTTASMMISQVKTIPTGAHGLFHKFAINALTLEGIGKRSTNQNRNSNYLSAPLYQVGRVVEGIFRSLNNLLERFNRSYWFYLLASTRRYISIGYYMIPFGLMAIPLLLKALNIYITMKKVEDDIKSDDIGSLWNALPFTFYCHVIGFLFAALPGLIQHYSWLYSGYNLKYKDTIFFSLISLSILLMLNPLVPLKKNSVEQMKAHKAIALINMALILSCISLLNISLALFLTLISVPIVLLCISTSSFVIRKFLSPFFILLHPLSIGYLCLLGISLWYDSKTPLVSHLNRAFVNHKSILLNYIEDWYIYGNWTFLFGSAFLFPAWLQVWYIL